MSLHRSYDFPRSFVDLAHTLTPPMSGSRTHRSFPEGTIMDGCRQLLPSPSFREDTVYDESDSEVGVNSVFPTPPYKGHTNSVASKMVHAGLPERVLDLQLATAWLDARALEAQLLSAMEITPSNAARAGTRWAKVSEVIPMAPPPDPAKYTKTHDFIMNCFFEKAKT